ncbi:MAG TPA: cytochrome c oxidase subunit 3 family protein [Thermoanaerobaculia bacterium]|nr:cytochrome c oxidase subunit 3 family protein [Thermoanaerobaculia bacterium]
MAAEVQPHAHVPGLAHQFESLEQQKEAATLGMWLFLVTEVLFFGGLFLAYTVYRWAFPASFIAASRTLDVKLGTINTAVLIGSSLTMVLAVRAARLGRGKLCTLFLGATIALGGVFLGIKAVEYSEKFREHHVPGASFRFEAEETAAPGHGARLPRSRAEETAPHAQMFFNLYFAMTGLHAFHMVVGVGIILFVMAQAWKGRYTPENHNFVEGVGLYWHFVDLIWIFLFPLLYLVGRHH